MYAVKPLFVFALTVALTPSVFAQDEVPTSLKDICYESALGAKKAYPKISVEKARASCMVGATKCVRITKEDKDMYNNAVKMLAGKTALINGVSRPISPEEAINLSCGLTASKIIADALSDGKTELNE